MAPLAQGLVRRAEQHLAAQPWRVIVLPPLLAVQPVGHPQRERSLRQGAMGLVLAVVQPWAVEWLVDWQVE